MSDKVLVLNATYEPLNVCTARRAIVLMLKQKAEAVETSGRVFHSAENTFELPNVIKLSYYVRVPRSDCRRVSAERCWPAITIVASIADRRHI